MAGILQSWCSHPERQGGGTQPKSQGSWLGAPRPAACSRPTQANSKEAAECREGAQGQARAREPEGRAGARAPPPRSAHSEHVQVKVTSCDTVRAPEVPTPHAHFPAENGLEATGYLSSLVAVTNPVAQSSMSYQLAAPDVVSWGQRPWRLGENLLPAARRFGRLSQWLACGPTLAHQWKLCSHAHTSHSRGPPAGLPGAPPGLYWAHQDPSHLRVFNSITSHGHVRGRIHRSWGWRCSHHPPFPPGL